MASNRSNSGQGNSNHQNSSNSSRQNTNRQQSTNNQRSQNQQNGTATALSQVARVIDKNTQETKNNTTATLRNTSSLGECVNALNTFARQFTNDARNFANSLSNTSERISNASDRNANNEEALTTNMERIFDRGAHRIDDSVSKAQMIGKSLLSALDVIGGRIVSELVGGAERVAEAYKSQFSNVTVKMQMDKADYSAMFNDVSKTFTEQGLNKQFSAVDFSEALSTALDEGLRGEEAQRQAYQNLITNKLIPAISTNTVAYRKMSKEFGDAFNQNVIAVSKYTEALYGAEGLEEGKLNNTIDSLQTTLDYATATGAMSQDQAMDAFNQIVMSINAMENAGINTDDFITNLNAILEGNVDAVSDQFHSMGIGTSSDLLRELSTDAFGLVEKYLDANAVSGSSLATQNEIISALGGNVKTGMQVVAATKSGRLDMNQVREDYSQFDAGVTYDKWKDALQDGFGQTADAILNKVEENAMTSAGVLSAQIPRFNELVSDVSSILDIVTDLAVSLLKGNRGTGFFGLGGRGAGAAGAGAGGAGAGGATAAGVALGATALVAGGTMAVFDAVNAGQVAADRGLGAGEIALQSARGFITGGTMMTAEEELDATSNALKGQKRDFDWGEVGENTLKGTLIGTGVGTAVGGWAAGIGTVVGAGVGAITGAVANIIDQAIENAKYNELADASNALSDSMGKLSSAQSNYDRTIQRSTQSRQESELLLSMMNGETTASTEELNTAFKSLQEKYPEYLGNIETVNELEPQYITALENKIKLENEIAGAELSNAGYEALNALDDVYKKFDAIASDNIKSTASLKFVDEIMKTGGENGKVYSSSEIDALLDKMVTDFGTNGMTKSDLIAELNSGKSGKIITQQKDGRYTLTGQDNEAGAGGVTWGDNMQEFAADYAKSESYRTQAISVLTEGETKINEIWNSIKSQADANKNEDGTYEFSDKTTESLKTLANQFNSSVKTYNDYASSYNLSSFKIKSSNYEGISEIFKAVGADAPSFKVGAYKIPSDETYAHLHRGEMVLTADSADQLRNLGAGGIDSLLAGLSAVSRARAEVQTSSDESSQQSAVTAAIESQTTSIVSVLTSILEVVQRISSGSSSISTPVTLSEDLLNFTGV